MEWIFEKNVVKIPDALSSGDAFEVVIKGEKKRIFHNAKLNTFFFIELNGNIEAIKGRKNLGVEPFYGEAAAAVGGAQRKLKPIKSQIAGKVLQILCKTGDLVKKGDPLLVIEAMKMENKILSPYEAKIAEIKVTENKQVAIGDELVTFSAGT